MKARHVMTPLYAVSIEMDVRAYQDRKDSLAKDGYRIVFVDRLAVDGRVRYGAIWVHDGAPVLTSQRDGLTLSAFRDALTERDEAGFLLRGFTCDGTHFSGLWNDGSNVGFRTRLDLTKDEYQAEFDAQAALGLRLQYVTGWAVNGESRYGAQWSRHDTVPRRARHNLPESEYQATFDALKREGYRIQQVNAHAAGRRTYFAGIWVKRDDYDPKGRHNMTASEFETEAKAKAGEDLQPTCLSAYRLNQEERYAAVWVPLKRKWLVQGSAGGNLGAAFDDQIRAHMQEFDIPGASLALTFQGRLVLARGYSWVTAAEPPVAPTSLFRIGSLTKAHTAAAILQLAEQGKLSLNDRFADRIAMPEPVVDELVRTITIRDLLHHAGGWDYENLTDPMDQQPQIAKELGLSLPLTRHSLLRWMNGQRLHFTPGTRFAYSNYGYVLLGLVIEAVTGKTYADFVREQIHAPLRIRRMRQARSLFSQRAPDEVLHHAVKLGAEESLLGNGLVMRQYGGYRNYEIASSGGSWLASAVDVVRFASCFDKPAECPILNRDSVGKMFAKHKSGTTEPTTDTYYGCGWFVDPSGSNQGARHGGTTEGSKSQVERWDGVEGKMTVALLFNKAETGDWSMAALSRKIADQARYAAVVDDFWEAYL